MGRTHVCRGVLNIVHGTHGTVNRILDHPDIKAVAFVGSDAAGRYIYERGSAAGKRVQARGTVKYAPLRIAGCSSPLGFFRYAGLQTVACAARLLHVHVIPA